MDIYVKKTIEVVDMAQSYIENTELIESFIEGYLTSYDIDYTELDKETRKAINNRFIEEVCEYLKECYTID